MREMKDSGIEWIGKIPEDWLIKKIKHNFMVFAGATPKSEKKEYWDGNIIWITPADYKTEDKYVCVGKKNITIEGYKSCGTTIVPKGSIIFSKRAPVGTVAISENELCTNQGCLSCVPHECVDGVYYYYVLSVFTEQFELLSTGTTFKEISANSFVNFPLPFPTYKEQMQISFYLNQKCVEIDNILTKTRTSIEEYRRLKQAVITQAITKGVRGDREMKDSGIEWIGEIPVTWDILRKLSYTCTDSISYGIVKLLEPDDDTGVKVLRCSDVLPGKISLDNVRTVTQQVSNEYARTILSGGEIVINIRGTLGGCAVVPNELKGYNVAREVAVIPANDDICKRYLMYFFLSDVFIDYQKRYLTGSVYVGLNIELLSSCPIILPPLKEQEKIADFLDEKCRNIDTLIEQMTELLVEMENYKKSVIYEYVTGKKEVKNH